MGQIFKAPHQIMGRRVALEVIRRDWVSQRAAVERFRREVRAAAQLDHGFASESDVFKLPGDNNRLLDVVGPLPWLCLHVVAGRPIRRFPDPFRQAVRQGDEVGSADVAKVKPHLQVRVPAIQVGCLEEVGLGLAAFVVGGEGGGAALEDLLLPVVEVVYGATVFFTQVENRDFLDEMFLEQGNCELWGEGTKLWVMEVSP